MVKKTAKKKTTRAARTTETTAKSKPAGQDAPTFEVRFVPIESVEPYPRNPRTITDDAVAKVAASIEGFGWQQPIVVDTDGVVIVGHTRLLAAQKLGLEVVPVRVAVGLTDEQIRTYRIADNRTGEESSWNKPLLVAELTELDTVGVSLLETSFTVAELDKMLKPTPEKTKGEFDQPKPVPKYECPKCGYKWSGAES